MSESDSTPSTTERLTQEESKHRTLLSADKRLSEWQKYPQLVRGFRRRSVITAIIMGFWLLLHATMLTKQVLGPESDGEESSLQESVGWGPWLVLIVIAAMLAFFAREARRCTSILRKLEVNGRT